MNDDTHHEPSIDLRALDPTLDSARIEGIVRAIAADAMSARSGAAARTGVLVELAAWARPALVAAALVLAVALPTLWRAGNPATAPALPSTDTMGIPRELALILHSSRAPSIAELHAAVLGAGAP